jgi:hypothetical protein
MTRSFCASGDQTSIDDAPAPRALDRVLECDREAVGSDCGGPATTLGLRPQSCRLGGARRTVAGQARGLPLRRAWGPTVTGGQGFGEGEEKATR